MAAATEAPQECPKMIALETPICERAPSINSACASGVHTVLRGRSLWPKPGRSNTMTR